MQPADPAPTPLGYRTEYAEEARKWALMRASDEDLARHFDISLATFHEWLAAVPEFARAVRLGRKMGDADAVDRFHQNVMGFAHEAVKIFRPFAAGEEPPRATYTHQYRPDTPAGIFWLVNRLPDQWRHKVEIEAKPNDENVPEFTRDELRRLIFQLAAARGIAAGGAP